MKKLTHSLLANVEKNHSKVFFKINDLYAIDEELQNRDNQIAELKRSINNSEEASENSRKKIAELETELYGWGDEVTAQLAEYNKKELQKKLIHRIN